MNEKLPVLREAIKQLKEKEKTDLADELNTLVEDLFVQIESKKERAIKKSEQKIDDFLNDHEKDIQIGNWKDDLAILAAEVSSTATEDTDGGTPDTEKKGRRSGMSNGRKKFRKRTGIATVVAGLALFASKAQANTTPKVEPEPPSETEDNEQEESSNITEPENEEKKEKGEQNERFSPIKSSYTITGRFGDRRKTRTHKGVDLAAKQGTPIYPIRPGKVSRTGYEKGGAGYFIVIDHGGGQESKYFHLQKRSTLRQGTKVDSTTVLGGVGNTGYSTGPTGMHLHLELRKDGKPVNPEKYCPLDHGAVA